MEFLTKNISGWQAALEGMRAPLKSYNKADSYFDYKNNKIVIGPRDYRLAKSLWEGGSEHRKWMRQVQVWVEIAAPLFFWSEWDTYHIGVSCNSESTMHTIGKAQLSIADFDSSVSMKNYSYKALSYIIEILNKLINAYNTPNLAKTIQSDLLVEIKSLLPCSYIQRRFININYEVLARMYQQRHNHRLPHWRVNFVNWINSLPYSEFITGNFTKEKSYDIIKENKRKSKMLEQIEKELREEKQQRKKKNKCDSKQEKEETEEVKEDKEIEENNKIKEEDIKENIIEIFKDEDFEEEDEEEDYEEEERELRSRIERQLEK